MTLLKDLYSKSFYENLSNTLIEIYPEFNKPEFIKDIYSAGFEAKELKERMRHTTIVIHKYMPSSYKETVELLFTLINKLSESEPDSANDRLAYSFLPDYIEVYGIDDYDTSVKAMEFITKFVSCEFAVRPFILKYKEKMIDQMIKWSKHEDPHVRRLASEGSRPRLPWAIALQFLKKDPSPIFPILENLKEDKHDFVRRSVANNINDISKDNPQIAIHIAKRWIGNSKDTDRLIKHACRTLLKQGNSDILKLYGLDDLNINVNNLTIKNKNIYINDNLSFSFEVENNKDQDQILRIEYGLYYMKSNGLQSRKVFKISERTFKPFEKAVINRKHPFKIITTRKFYTGEHKISVIINGKELLIDLFYLLKD
ncbi:MAG: DNA alkylation repair protein [Bacteroidales bacterium]|jgi:3-methyladenine DNA glycosylase AlkC|nr:DNA alkylation repair protein [Bacteroidales bacterium]